MYKKFNILCIFLSILLSILYFSFAFAGKEINITADKMEVLESEGLVVFTGHVKAIKKDLKVWANKLYVYYNKNKGQRNIYKIIALGQVIIKKQGWKGYCDKAVYFKDQNKLVLEGNPKVWYKNDLVEGDIITVYFNEDRSEVLAKGEGRVKVYLHEE